MKQKIIILVAIAILVKVLYFAFAIGISNYTGSKSLKTDYSGYINTLKKNDAYWYENIALNGYPKVEHKEDLGFHDGSEYKQSEWAFFPFYPLSISTVSKIFNLNPDTATLLISYFFSILGFILFYIFLIRYVGDERLALLTVVLLIIFPFHYYYSVFYTEAIFFSFLMGSFLSIQRKKYWITSILIIPLTLIRPNGIILIIPLYLFMLEREGLVNRWKIDFNQLFKKPNIVRSLYFLSAPMCFILYGFYQQMMTGEFFAFSIAQQGWYREFRFPLLSFFREGNLANQFNSIYTILFILLGIFSWKKFPLSLNLLIWLSLLLPLTSGSVQSMPRFISLIFPFMMIFGIWVSKTKASFAIITLLFAIQLFTYYFWLTNHPLSY